MKAFLSGLANVWPRYATIFALLAVLGVLGLIYGYRFGFWGLGPVFNGFRTAIPILGIAALLSAAGAGALLFRKSWLASVAALSVAAAAGGLAYLPIWMRGEGAKVPPIHDITTDTMDPPAFVAILPLREDAPNPAAYDPEQTAQQLEAYPDLEPLIMPLSAPEAFEIALSAVEAEGLKLVAVVPEEGRIEAYETVPLFGFKDDVVVRLQSAGEITTVIDIRSKSRVGRSDLGFNARRIRSMLDHMEAVGGSIAAPTGEEQDA